MKFYGVFLEETNELCYTWDKKHPEDKREEKSLRLWAIYPNKKNAYIDAKFRGGCYVKEIFIKGVMK